MGITLNGKWYFRRDKNSKCDYKKVAKEFADGKIQDQMGIPINWQLAGLNNFNGAVWFIRKISISNDEDKNRFKVLRFEGVDYFCDVWINGEYIGNHEGYFQRFWFDITENINANENLVVIKVTSPLEEPGKVWPNRKKLIKGIFNHHDCRPGGWDLKHGQDQNTGGIWNDISVDFLEGVYCDYSKIKSIVGSDKKNAKIKIDIRLYSFAASDTINKIIFKIIDKHGVEKSLLKNLKLNPGKNDFTVAMTIEEPKLWYSWDLGEQNIYKLIVSFQSEILHEANFGIREVQLDSNQKFYLNGDKLFLRGTNVIPDQFLSRLTDEKIKMIVRLMKEANINVVRVHAHVNRKEFYDECDNAGIIVWQDFALQWTYNESEEFKKNAVSQIKDMVRLNFNHPSIAFWCCHNEPGEQIATLDTLLFDAVKEEDDSRIIRKASNFEEHPYDGWYWGKKEHFAAAPMGPLVTEFGAQALPGSNSLKKIVGGDLYSPDYKIWKYHNFQYEQTFQIAKIDSGKSIKEFVDNSQSYQAELLKTAVNYYRREKNRKIAGIFQFMFIDCWESISWSVVDFYGVKKAGYYALKESYQPIYLSLNLWQDTYFPNSLFKFDIFIINDMHTTFKNCTVKFEISKKEFGMINLKTIERDSIEKFNWEKLRIFLPDKLKTGKHSCSCKLLDNKLELISETSFVLMIEKKIKI